MFETLPTAPPDAILGLDEAVRRDPRPEKINLGAGVYKDETGETPVFAAVQVAERRLAASQPSKSYLPIEGHPEFIRGVQRLLFGDENEILAQRRAATAQTPGGTGALRVAGDFLKEVAGASRLWLSEPTWPNHPQVFGAVGLPIETYPYFDPATNGLDFTALVDALEAVRPGDVVVLHGVCHNPTGVDPDLEQWAQIGELLAGRGALPLVDFAYQGLAHGLEIDVSWLHVLVERVPEVMVCSSYSKSFGLYNERVGALTLVARSAQNAEAALSQVKRIVRANYSNPPAHGAEVVAAILSDPELEALWRRELGGMCERIQRMRRLLAAGLDQRGARLHPMGNEFIARQNGMFSFSGLSRAQVERLREQAAIYVVGSGRINVAGITEANVERLCDAVAAVL